MKRDKEEVRLFEESTEKRYILLFCFLVSALFLLFSTKSSPLYPFNDWVDVNAFFTVGKGMMRGLVPYRDLFEQKGPLLYFVYGLASLVSYKTFIGGFILEVIAFTFFLFFSYKSISLFVDKKWALLSLPILSILILNLKAFTHGGSAEELCLPLLSISLYHLLKYLKHDDPTTVTIWTFFWNGVIAGCILWVKFSMLGFWLGWILSLFVSLVAQKRTRQAFTGVVFFLGGMLAATIPWIIYFGVNHAIPDLINTYFIVNLTGYSDNLSFINRGLRILSYIGTLFSYNPIFGSLLWLGIISFAVFPKFLDSLWNRLLLLLCEVLFVIGIYGGGRGFVYYYLIITPLVIFGVVVGADAISSIIKKPLSERISLGMTIAIVILSLPLTYYFNQNSYLLHIRQQDLVQYKFAEIIDQSADKTLLNYGWLDMGFYTTAGVLPNVKYFELQNLDYSRYPLNLDEQNRYVREGLTKFIMLRDVPQKEKTSSLIPQLNSRYRIVASGDQYYEGYTFTYFLFERMD